MSKKSTYGGNNGIKGLRNSILKEKIRIKVSLHAGNGRMGCELSGA